MPPPRTFQPLTATTALALAGWALAARADEPTYRDVPLLYTQTPGAFRAVFGGAMFTPRHAIMIGDSQETCPGGRGDVYIPRFNAELWSLYRSSPATPWTTAYTSYGGGEPWGAWMLRAAYAPPGMTDSRVPTSFVPPGFEGGKTSTRSGINVNANQLFGQLYMLQPGCESVNPGAGVSGTVYMNTASGVWLDVMAATSPTSGEVSIRMESVVGSTPDFFVYPSAVLETHLGLQSPEYAVRAVRLGPFEVPPGRYLQADIAGTDPTRFTDLIAVRFVSVADGRGMSLTPLAAGGYRSDSFLSSHGDSNQVVEAMGADLAFICYGANDVGSYHTPEVYRQYVEGIISWLRWSVSPTLPVVLLAETPQGGLDERQQGYFDRYPAMNQAIAEADPLVCAVNSRRMVEAEGWTTAHRGPYMADDAHYSPAGATLKAKVEVRALLEAFAPPCRADVNGDGFIDFFDYDDFVTCFEGGACPTQNAADVNEDGFIDFFDYDLFVELFETACRG